MSLKEKLLDTGAIIYSFACCGAGIVAGKNVFDYLHNPDHSTLETVGIGVLSVYAGLFAAGLLISPVSRRLNRRILSKCSECENGRLHKKTEVLGEFKVPWSFGYYGIRGAQDIVKCRDTINCDRCGHQTIGEYNREGSVHL